MTRHFLNGPNTQKKREKLKLFYYSQVFFLFNLLGLRTCVRRRDQKENGDCSSEGSNCATHVSPHVAKKQPFLPPEMLLFSSHICIKRININSNWIQVFVRYRLSYVGTKKWWPDLLKTKIPLPRWWLPIWGWRWGRISREGIAASLVTGYTHCKACLLLSFFQGPLKS